MKFGVEEVARAVAQVRASGGSVTVAPYTPPDSPNVNEYCIFFKPETTEPGVDFPSVYEAVFGKLRLFGQEPSSCIIVGSRFLTTHRIMQEHYGVIDAISRHGVTSLSPDAMERLHATFGANATDRISFLGAHQFLREFPEFSAAALAVLFDNLQSIKLAGGTHCVRLSVRGRDVVLFNGFHPLQLEHYERDGAVLVVMSCTTGERWHTLRTDMTGSTNPQLAQESSIRAMLLRNRQSLRISEVSTGKNGVHVSAGPLEGMLELYRFLRNSDSAITAPSSLAFGRLMAASGLATDQIEFLCTNPDLAVNDTKMSAFDITEERDAADAIGRLRAAINA